MLLYYFLVVIAIWLGLLSLRGGLRFAAYVRRELGAPLSDYTPFVSVIAPFRGVEEGLWQNFAALFQQDYPAYQIIFVTDSPDDAALSLLHQLQSDKPQSDKLQFVDDFNKNEPQEFDSTKPYLLQKFAGESHDHLKIIGQVNSQVMFAGPASDSGQKVHNLRHAVSSIDTRTEVIVFVDSDARPHANWLRSLVAPLVDANLGATTGYRWFVASPFHLAGQLRSVWNASIASALGAQRERNFCWGGSTAIRRQTFEKLGIAARWRGSVSDDFTLTSVLHEANLPIKFVPQCLLVSNGECGVHELLEFTNRQLKITRVYAAHLWKALLLGSAQFVLVFFGGFALLFVRWWFGLPSFAILICLGIIFGLGAAKAWIRLQAVKLALANYELSLDGSLPAQLLLWPFASALFLANAIAAGFSRRIRWRGISYELKSAREAVIIGREPDSL